MMLLRAFEEQAANCKHQESGGEISDVDTKRTIHDQPNKEQAPWKS